MGGISSISVRQPQQDDLFEEATKSFGPALARLVSAYEADPDRRLDLSQEIQLQLWRSFANFNHHCSLRTWTYRVAHNVAASYLIRERRSRTPFVSLEDLDIPAPAAPQTHQSQLGKLESLIQRLRPSAKSPSPPPPPCESIASSSSSPNSFKKEPRKND